MSLDEPVFAQWMFPRVRVLKIFWHGLLPRMDQGVIGDEPFELLLHLIRQVIVCLTGVGKLGPVSQRSIFCEALRYFCLSTGTFRRNYMRE